MTIARKQGGVIYESTYFVGRTAILVFSLGIPLTIFHFRELSKLIPNLILGFLALFLFDPLHHFFGVGYYQVGHQAPDYYYNNFLFFIIYAMLGVTLGYMKIILEKYELKYERLIEELNKKSLQIEKQKDELISRNYLLENVLTEKDQNISGINQELVRQNNELLQFSYTISHQFRGPVASILGLLNLIETKTNENEQQIYLTHLSKSVHALDAIMRELTNILEIRNDSFNEREKISLEEELRLVLKSFESVTKSKRIKIHSNFNVLYIYSVKSYIHSIFYQLIANAIQFRSPDRDPEINVRSFKYDEYVVIDISDNGIGIDLEQYKDYIFKPFKKFHISKSGKGLGLYLVKLQLEKLDGRIIVESKPGFGSKFKLYLKDQAFANF